MLEVTDGFDHRILGFDSVTFRPPGRVNYYNVSSLKAHLTMAGFKIESAETPGWLDVDIVKEYCKSGAVTGLPPFFSDLFMDDNNKKKADAFQVFFVRTSCLATSA